MPLIQGKSDRAFSRNVATEMEHDKPLAQSLAIAYSMKRKAEQRDKYAYGGEVESEHCLDCDLGHCDIHDRNEEDGISSIGGDIVGRIMKDQKVQKMSEGGRVANQEHGPNDSRLAGFSRNEFDDLVLRDDLEQSYTGENSGDELGNAQEDEDRRDLVSQIMRSLAKKDRMPIAGYGVSYGKYK
jgi:hypothetical protein